MAGHNRNILASLLYDSTHMQKNTDLCTAPLHAQYYQSHCDEAARQPYTEITDLHMLLRMPGSGRAIGCRDAKSAQHSRDELMHMQMEKIR